MSQPVILQTGPSLACEQWARGSFLPAGKVKEPQITPQFNGRTQPKIHVWDRNLGNEKPFFRQPRLSNRGAGGQDFNPEALTNLLLKELSSFLLVHEQRGCVAKLGIDFQVGRFLLVFLSKHANKTSPSGTNIGMSDCTC